MRKRTEVPPPAVTDEKVADAPNDVSGVESFLRNNVPDEQQQEIPLSPDFEKIVTKIFVDEPDKVFDRLEALLKVGEKRDDRGSVLKALDEAEVNARLAYKLWSTAQRERVRWEKDNETIHGGMRVQANKILQAEKNQGLRSKQITDADVEAMCATLFPDEWRSQEVRKASVKAMEESLKNLSELWGKRVSSLGTML